MKRGTCLGVVLLALGTIDAADPLLPPCDIVLHEERVELEDARLAVDLARSSLEAFGEVFELIDGLRKIDGIDRMTHLRAKYDFDAAVLDLERSELLLRRQEALLENVTLVCDATDEISREQRNAIDEAHRRYTRADCDQQAKAIDVARVGLEFRREYLASILDLREGQVATRQDVILATLEVRHEEQRLADAERRTKTCRASAGPARP